MMYRWISIAMINWKDSSLHRFSKFLMMIMDQKKNLLKKWVYKRGKIAQKEKSFQRIKKVLWICLRILRLRKRYITFYSHQKKTKTYNQIKRMTLIQNSKYHLQKTLMNMIRFLNLSHFVKIKMKKLIKIWIRLT